MYIVIVYVHVCTCTYGTPNRVSRSESGGSMSTSRIYSLVHPRNTNTNTNTSNMFRNTCYTITYYDIIYYNMLYYTILSVVFLSPAPRSSRSPCGPLLIFRCCMSCFILRDRHSYMSTKQHLQYLIQNRYCILNNRCIFLHLSCGYMVFVSCSCCSRLKQTIHIIIIRS